MAKNLSRMMIPDVRSLEEVVGDVSDTVEPLQLPPLSLGVQPVLSVSHEMDQNLQRNLVNWSMYVISNQGQPQSQ